MSSNEYATTLPLVGGQEEQPLATRRGSTENSWKEDLPKEESVFSTMSTRGAQSIMHQERKENILRRIQGSINRPLLGGVNETTSLLIDSKGSSSASLATTAAAAAPDPYESLKEMILDNRIHVLFAFIPLACISHACRWGDGCVFVLNFLAMIPLASLLGAFTEELAAHTNDVVGGLINATFGNAVELVVAIQALLHGGKCQELSKKNVVGVWCDFNIIHTRTRDRIMPHPRHIYIHHLPLSLSLTTFSYLFFSFLVAQYLYIYI